MSTWYTIYMINNDKIIDIKFVELNLRKKLSEYKTLIRLNANTCEKLHIFKYWCRCSALTVTCWYRRPFLIVARTLMIVTYNVALTVARGFSRLDIRSHRGHKRKQQADQNIQM